MLFTDRHSFWQLLWRASIVVLFIPFALEVSVGSPPRAPPLSLPAR